MKPARFWIEKLALTAHPEGGWFKETFRSEDEFSKQQLPERYSSPRNASTCIYYLLNQTDRSCFHRLQSDESWHYYAGGSPVRLYIISDEGKLETKLLGRDPENNESFQVHIPRNHWFAAELTNQNDYALVGCTVAPGFNFEDFEMGTFQQLSRNFPQHNELLKQFTLT